tara:strand:+ start:574 stop:795 length:222 start_codon:yes stop_codon:yes gene_type:complete
MINLAIHRTTSLKITRETFADFDVVKIAYSTDEEQESFIKFFTIPGGLPNIVYEITEPLATDVPDMHEPHRNW